MAGATTRADPARPSTATEAVAEPAPKDHFRPDIQGIRALAVDDTGLRVAPTDDDIAALRADGYVGDVLHELRRRAQAGGDETARAALLLLSDTMLALRQDEQVSR